METSIRMRGLFNASALALTAFLVHLVSAYISGPDTALYYFLLLFVWRYARFLINLVAFWLYTPAALDASQQPTYQPSRDVTVILPTVDPTGPDFMECLLTCAANSPAEIHIVTAGDALYRTTKSVIAPLRHRFPTIRLRVSRTQVASKRAQVAHAIPLVTTAFTVLLDDHVFWKPNFLTSLLLPFEDANIGLVGTNKAVRRLDNLSLRARFWNMIGAIYLLRHNFEIRASNTVDGGVFVVSARTCALRTEIIQDPAFLAGYTREMFFFGLLGPLNASDDNFVTRWVVQRGWGIKIQYTADAEIETTIGVAEPIEKKFLGQCRRWARSTWKSNVTSLVRDGRVWATQPYCVYAVFLTSFTNFAAVVDPALVYFLRSSESFGNSGNATAVLIAWIFFTKIFKVFSYFRKHPQDIWMFPGYLAFAYAHSFKFWALLTFWDVKWSGRNLDAIAVDTTGESSDNEMVANE